MIDEYDARKPNFDEPNSVAVTFANEHVFYLPKPWLEIRPVFKDGKAIANWPAFTYGPAIDALLEAEAGAEDLHEQMVGVASLAAYLLQWHYTLSDGDLDELLCYRVGDEASTAWFTEVMSVATGASGPKRLRAGGV